MIEIIIIFLVVLAVLIFVHELGHFLFARASGIRVDEFSLGFGPKIWSRGIYSVRAIPFGGYVKIFGEDGAEEETESEAGKEADKSAEKNAEKSRPIMPPARGASTVSFARKPAYVQIAILFAGILFNFIFGWLVMSVAFMGGLPVSTEDYAQYANRFHNERIIITDVSADSPALKAGLTEGDTIVAISGSVTGAGSAVAAASVPTPAPTSADPLTISEIQSVVDASAGQPVIISYTTLGNENGATVESTASGIKTATLTPVQGLIPGHYAIGIAMDTAATLSLPLPSALVEGAKFTWSTIEETVIGVGTLIQGVFQGNHAILSEVSGPVGIAALVGQAAEIGWASVLMLTALISVNLGVLNLLPFPALDGGRILFVIIEAIIRRPIKPSVANTVNTVGFALLMLLMIAVTYHDIIKLI